ncbi:DUF58 domain-containing protein [Acetivibrio mesophilus]|uniref:DUF58 domain-containing protein n=1 Tax=Acetivibrio mesophilus TaxID=2487273 RepID=A0A4Q0I6H9_9FIRM|nr:DUF58 domain-containing protein [Acetivibrio mesophilus]RXE59517.1 DUF58 domain-containing protein [Acetivibrio mesophilus]
MPGSVTKVSIIFLILISIGFLFANNILILVSIIPFTLMAFGYYLKMPDNVRVKKTISKNRVAVGELLDVSVKILIESGFGSIEICDVIPQHFELVEGSNYCAVWKGFELKELLLNYTIRCTASGTYSVKTTSWKSRHAMGVFSVNRKYETDLTVEVTPRFIELKKVRGMSTACKVPMPEGALASMGMTTQEFKELRLYSPGDPFKSINWKVTSRNLVRGNVWPVVNEFEKEGKKSVWIFLDTSRIMAFGSNIKNVKEYSVEAVNSLSDYYINHNCSVSFHTFGGSEIFVNPGSGRQHHYRILRELMKIRNFTGVSSKSSAQPKTLEETVQACRSYFSGLRPMFVIVTRFCRNNAEEIQKGINLMSRYTMLRKGYVPSIMLVNIMGYGLMAENQNEVLAADVLEAMNKVVSAEIRKSCIWIDWDPNKESLTGALLKQVVT